MKFKLGDRHYQITTIQFLLRDFFDLPSRSLLASGEYDDRTERAVIEFQRRNGLKVTGVCDYSTWAKLHFSTGRQLSSK